jgi:hypothetical protein
VNLIYPDMMAGNADCAKTAAAFALINQADLRARSVLEDDPAIGSTLESIVEAATASLEAACPVGG